MLEMDRAIAAAFSKSPIFFRLIPFIIFLSETRPASQLGVMHKNNMSELLIPSVGPNKLIPGSPESAITKSEQDSSIRPFGCTFHLEDTRARTLYIALEVVGNSDFHIKMESSDINFYIQSDDKNKLSSVLVGCMVEGKDQALTTAFPHMQRITSLWCLKYKRPVNIYSIEIYDKSNKAKWLIPNVTPSISPRVVGPVVTLWNTALTSLVAVFKEGMNSTIFSHKLISYYKILEAYPSQGPFKEINNYCKEKRMEVPRESKVLSEELLKGAFDKEYHAKYVGKKYTRIRDELKGYRNAIAHPFISDAFIDLDTFEVQAELAAISNMLERMAVEILEEEIGLLSKVSPDNIYKQLAESYTYA